jgi:TonB-dependent starch-binding outer membrane protein SusC
MKKVTLTFVLINLFLFSRAQQVTGKVVEDSSDAPLSSVSVSLKGRSGGTTTNSSGEFTLAIPSSQRKIELVISSSGYATVELSAQPGQSLVVRMHREVTDLNEVVVIGYGTVRRKDLTGSVVSLKGSELKKVPSTNVLEAAQGKIAGADITRSSGQAGAGVNIRIRGNRSIGGNNSPLVIVDGVQYNNIQDINPNDIESMEILKDASSVAIYGSRGANGVILITTKSGTAGKLELSLNSYAGLSEVAMYPKPMGFDEFVAFKREAYRAAGQWNSPTDDPVVFAGAGELNAVQKRIWVDYLDELFHRGVQQEHQVGLRAGTEKLKAYMSMGFFNEQGVLRKDWLQRYTGRLNVDYTVNSKLRVGLQSQLTYYKQSARRDPLNQANKISPFGSLYDSAGNFNLTLLENGPINPLADEQPNAYENSNLITRSLINAYIDIRPVTGLVLKSTIGVNLVSARNGTFSSAKSIDRFLSGKSQSSIAASNGRTINWENVATYSKTAGRHSITVTGVASYLGSTSDDVTATGVNQLLPSQLFYALQNTTEQKEIFSSYSKSDLLSVAGRVNYSFNSKYLLTLTARGDGSSKLSEGHKWTFFPSAAVAWRIKDESFMNSIGFINDLKLRLSYGVAGNDPSGPYATQSALTRLAFGWDETAAPAYTFSRLVGNTDLAWELSRTKNIGLDAVIWKNRINLTVDLYDTRTSDLLLVRGLPPTTGVTTVNQNVGKTKNRGVEITLGTTNISNSKLTWTTNLTFTHNEEKIVELVTAEVNDIGNGWFIGQPINVFYDYEKRGIWQTKDAAEAATFNQKPGDIRVWDQDGNGSINSQNDRIILGNPRPKWSGGLENTVTYKGFDFRVFVFARVGQMIQADRYGKFNAQGTEVNMEHMDYWTPENPTNAYPRPNKNGGLLYLSTLAYQKGSFARIRDLSLGYTIPAKTLQRSFIKGFRVYATGKNLITFTKLDYDPERGGSESFPMTRLFVMGVNVTL